MYYVLNYVLNDFLMLEYGDWEDVENVFVLMIDGGMINLLEIFIVIDRLG